MQRTPTASRRDAALEFLLSRIDYERATAVPYRLREFRLDRMHELLDRLGNPQAALKIVHLAGTKGKGSTAAMTAAILTAAGYRTGLYTSPHLERIEERVAIDGRSCTTEQFVALVDRLRPIVEAMDGVANDGDSPPTGPTYFEITTAMAFLHFAEQRVDAAVVEVGLGGRLDSTNVVTPLVSAITNISFDHMKQLGTTLPAIAREKAGIIKPGVPVVSGVLDESARKTIDEIRRERGCALMQLGDHFDFDFRAPRELDRTAARGEMDFRLRRGDAEVRLSSLELALLGRHQAANAAVALAAVGELQWQGWDVSEAAIRRGLAEVRCPARVEVVARRPTVVVDAAHNLASVESLLATLDESFAPPQKILVFATTQEKQVREMLELLLPRFERTILTRYTNNPRGVPLEELDALAAQISDRPREICPTPADAWRRVGQLATPEHLICVTGSFFLAAEVRTLALQAAQAGRFLF